MLIYKQSTFDILMKHENGASEHSIKSESGIRIENNNMTKVNTYKDAISLDDIKLNISSNDLHRLDDFITKLYKQLKSTEIKLSSYLYLHNEKVFINNISDIRNYGFLKMVFEKDNYFVIEEIPISAVNFGNLENKITKVTDRNNLFLKFPIKNKIHKTFKGIPVVFSPHAAGFLIHEIIGHTLEYDIYKYYSDKYKYLQFSSKLNVKDDPKKVPELTGVGKYDDLGFPTSCISLVKNGIISNVFSLNSNNSTDNLIHGVGRRENYKHGILPRARCTYVEPVYDMDKKDIINKYKQCILVDKIHSGGINPQDGNFELNGLGFLINNNEAKNLIGNLKITGNLLKNFNTIEYIGNDLRFLGGYCFKLGQSVRIAVGAPTMSMYDLSGEGDFCE